MISCGHIAKLQTYLVLKMKHFVIIITILGFLSCQNDEKPHLTKIQGSEIAIDASLPGAAGIDAYIAPYRDHVNKVLDSALAYAPANLSKTDGQYSSSLGNLLADIILKEANPIFKGRTGQDIDFVLMNHGGMRSDISTGNVNARTAYQVMPFENNIVVAKLPGKAILEMVRYLIKSGRPHLLSGIEIEVDKNDSLRSIKINNRLFNSNRTYNVATSNYLVGGGDHMDFFREGLETTDTDYLIRNAIIDYFKKVDTLQFDVKDRFKKLN